MIGTIYGDSWGYYSVQFTESEKTFLGYVILEISFLSTIEQSVFQVYADWCPIVLFNYDDEDILIDNPFFPHI